MPKPQLTYCHKKCATLSVKGDTLSLQLKLGLCNKCHIFFVNCTQFQIVGTSDRGGDNKINYLKNNDWKGLWDSPFVNGNKVYKRLFIKRVS